MNLHLWPVVQLKIILDPYHFQETSYLVSFRSMPSGDFFQAGTSPSKATPLQ
jgi:hypothetical protein